VKKEKKQFKKPASLIGFFFQKFEKNVSVWYKIETLNGVKRIIETLRLNKEEYKTRRNN
jgi:hypothetical protein